LRTSRALTSPFSRGSASPPTVSRAVRLQARPAITVTANAIARITTSGVITEYPLPTAAAFPHAIMPYFNNLWFTEPGANQIGAITEQGQITEYPIPTPNGMPWDIATLDGIWFTERAANRFGHLQAPL